MIYLRKYNNDQPINIYPNLYDYLHNKMESVNDYCSRIKKEPFSKELNEDISWHLYQLMDIFCNCQILYDWNCSPTPLTKALLFCSLKSKKKIIKYLDPNKHVFIDDNKIINELNNYITICANDLVDSNQVQIKYFLRNLFKISKNYSSLEKYEEIYFDYLFQQGLWTNLRVLPNKNEIIGYAKNKEYPALNFFNSTLFMIDDYENLLSPVTDTSLYLFNSLTECINSFRELYKIKKENEKLEEYLTNKKFTFDDNLKIKQQFIQLLKDESFRIIKNFCPDFEIYCYILLTSQYLEYKNNTLHEYTKGTFPIYFLGAFIHDSQFQLSNHYSKIKDSIWKLFGLTNEKQLADKTTDFTYKKNYLPFSSDLLNRINEFQNR